MAEKAKNDATKKAACVAELRVEAMNVGVKELFSSEKPIEHWGATILRFIKLSDQWLSVTHSMNTAIKEIGDFENWMRPWNLILEASMQLSTITKHEHVVSPITLPSVYVLCTVPQLWSSH